MVTQLKCIEGWSVIVRWAGARLADLIAKYPPLTKSGSDPDVMRRPDDLVGYVSLETPDSEYYVGIDMESALHPQTLLCFEMNGQPLSLKHGAPLRLVTSIRFIFFIPHFYPMKKRQVGPCLCDNSFPFFSLPRDVFG